MPLIPSRNFLVTHESVALKGIVKEKILVLREREREKGRTSEV